MYDGFCMLTNMTPTAKAKVKYSARGPTLASTVSRPVGKSTWTLPSLHDVILMVCISASSAWNVHV